ncbi:MAG TPA: ECF-type sigma factor [Blastocatellia bacterium]|nr:ECF-type sigma factor [Blastocatellia bacterium]
MATGLHSCLFVFIYYQRRKFFTPNAAAAGGAESEWYNLRRLARLFGVAAQAMRRVLVDYARARNYQKRAGKAQHVSLDEAANIAEERAAEIVALDDALESLASFDQRKCRVVELRYFGGLSVEETVEVLGVSVPTVMRDWNTAKVWLLREMNQETGDDA